MKKLTPGMFALFILGCSGIPENQKIDLLSANPIKAQIWVLSGEGVRAKSVTINEQTIDTHSQESITRTVSEILASNNKPSLVSEMPAELTADTRIDFTAPGKPVSRLFYGFNAQWESKYFLPIPKYQALLEQISIDTLRFPGGQERGRFEPEALSRPEDNLGPNGRYQYVLTGEDVRNYIALCRKLGIEAQIEVNMTNDDPAMAARLVDYVINTLKYDLKYVSMGNEPEINNFDAWKYWEANSRSGAMASYLDRYLRYAESIRSVKPDIKLIFGEFGNASASEISAMFKPLGGKLPDKLRGGAFSTHRYVTGDWGQQTTDALDYPAVGNLIGAEGLNKANSFRDLYHFMRQEADEHLGGGQLFVGEWGASWSAQERSVDAHDTLATALFAAEAQETGKQVGFDSMQWFAISDPASYAPWNPSLIAVDGDTMKLRPQYYVYFLYKHLWGKESAQVSGKHRTDNLSVYASKDGDKNYLMLINRAADQTLAKVVRVVTATGEKTLRLSSPAHSITVIQL